MDIQSFEPRIRAILSAPDTDLSTISAKRVRKQLREEEGVNPQFLYENKRSQEDDDEGEGEGEGEQEVDDEDSGVKRNRNEDGDVGEDIEEEEEEKRRPKKKTKASKTELSDAELARQLSNELNGRSRSSRAGTSTRGRGRTVKANGGAKRGRKVKSAETVQSGDEGSEASEAPKKRGGGFKKEYALSEELAAILNVERMSRPQVVKHLWIYIKENGLQFPDDRRQIVCDDRLRALFGVDKISMFTMNKVLGNFLHDIEA
ncbi:hypothetical protein EW146_g6939 [Bondarzewia mesenterica]|uniref:DM2 domain-containing protein n=1 Tax=Bondarzewia mesenterica TaxID=1095465 RepID=A0A4S4LMU2_9AGAM|nr:hypothetical protein EW146_g6939 [Bondarzewia mesenterica]